MSYPTFVDVLKRHDIQDTTMMEYYAAWELYEQDLQDGDVVTDFKTWLVDHLIYTPKYR